MTAIYLKEATLPELLAEVNRRFEALNPLPEWAAATVFAVAAYYGFHVEDFRAKRRHEPLAKARQLAIAILARRFPGKSRAEVCAVLNVEHHMYSHSIARTEERCRNFPDFRREVLEIDAIIRETGHCRTAPQVTSPPSVPVAS